MLYYYFGSKDGLFLAVLDYVLASLNAAERSLDLSSVSPEEGVTRVAHFLWDYYRDHPDLVRLLNDENLREEAHEGNDEPAAERLAAARGPHARSRTWETRGRVSRR